MRFCEKFKWKAFPKHVGQAALVPISMISRRLGRRVAAGRGGAAAAAADRSQRTREVYKKRKKCGGVRVFWTLPLLWNVTLPLCLCAGDYCVLLPHCVSVWGRGRVRVR